MKTLTKLSLVLLISISLFSCRHPKEGEIVRDKDGNYYVLNSEGNTMPANAYRLNPIDTTKFKVVGFK